MDWIIVMERSTMPCSMRVDSTGARRTRSSACTSTIGPSTTASGVRLDRSYQREPIEVQMRALQEQKKDLESKVDALLDEARKRGVESSQLR